VGDTVSEPRFVLSARSFRKSKCPDLGKNVPMVARGLNLHREAFASGIAANMSLEKTYIAAGYKSKGDSVYRAAKRLANRAEIIERVQAIKDEKKRIQAEQLNSRSSVAPSTKSASWSSWATSGLPI
jgi:hypothetical protein